MKLRRNQNVSTWRMFFRYVAIRELPRGYPTFSLERGGECGEELRSLCYPLQHFDDSLVLMVYDALLDR